MYWILFVMAAIAAVVIALVVGGLATPREHAVARTTVVPAAPDAVWSTIRDASRHPELAFDVEDEDAPRRLVAALLSDDGPSADTWTWTLQPEGDGTRVIITQRRSIGNPVFRFIGTHFIGHTKTLDRYLRGLAELHGARAITIDDATPA